MAVQAADVLAPAGRLDRLVLWPGKAEATVTTIVQAYLTDGLARTTDVADEDTRDEAVTLWAYYRAYDAKYQSLLMLPAQVTDSDEGSSAYLQAQIEAMLVLRDAVLAEFNAVVDAVGVTQPVRPRMTVNAPTTFAW